MESTTYIKDLKISPKKLRFLLPELKKLKPVEALDYLMYMPKRPAGVFYKVFKSAINNAKNFLKVDEKMLRLKHLSIEQGHRLKRFRAGGRGMAKPILKRFSHIKIILVAEKPKMEEVVESKKLHSPKSKVKSQKLKSQVKNKK